MQDIYTEALKCKHVNMNYDLKSDSKREIKTVKSIYYYQPRQGNSSNCKAADKSIDYFKWPLDSFPSVSMRIQDERTAFSCN